MENIINEEITVHVRSPSLNETLQVKTTLNATVLTLKNSIEPVHPHHPKPATQRIIYSGKLLEDTDILAELLKKNDQEVIPTFHLVVKPSLDAATSRARLPMSNTPPPCPQQPQHSGNFSTSGTPHTGFGMPQYQYQQQTQPMHPSSLAEGYQVVYINGQYYLAPTLVLFQNLSPQNSMNTQMFPTVPHSLYQQQSAAFTSQPPLTHHHQQQQQQQQQQQEPIVQPFINQFPQQQQQNNPIFAANGPMFGQPANAQRAASIWLALKLIVVLFMLCQGASIERIFIFHVIAFVFFLYQTGRLRFVLRRVRVEDLNRFRAGNDGGLQRPGPPPTHPPTPNVNGNPNTENNTEGASTSVSNNNNNLTQRRQDGNEATASGEDAVSGSSHVANEPARPLTALDVWKRGAYAFFASLWPTYGVDPQIAQAFQNDNNNNNQEQ
ncbi:hypothetical protein [Parasitella parasitica]|uniref:Ubiquitin-like domain-containing protein n=1 Tax=Parasitella parasitica TaxID=35722 RepID=A0A0B7ND52_9FUNG|nr:hypothetical protein [Parasitella parasitica]